MANRKNILTLILLSSCCIVHNISAFNFNVEEFILGKSGCASYGTESNTKWYQEKAREFLTNFGIKNAQDVQIYKLNLTANPEMKLIPGITARDGIWFNEDLMNNFSEQERTWFVAHETAHFTYKHILAKYLILNIQKAGLAIWSGLFGAGFTWAIQHYDILKKHSLLAGAIFGTYLTFMGTKRYVSNSIMFLNFEKELEKQADLQAASMLCSHGLESVVLVRIETLKNQIGRGFFLINSLDHPSLEETLAYLQAFWNAWTQQKTQPA